MPLATRAGWRQGRRGRANRDASRDGTWDLLHRLFGARSDTTLLRHDRNRGVAAAILTGLRAAGTEIVCSIDCDCTYDPHGLADTG